jgi:hypothetical protein
VKSKTVALLVLLIVLAGTLHATSAPIEVSSDEPMSLYDIFAFLFGTSVALGDPVPGSGGSGGDD